MKKRLLALLLSLSVALGNVGPAFAAEEPLSDASIEEMESVESVENGLLIPLRTKEISESLEKTELEKAQLVTNLNIKAAYENKEDDFRKVFGENPKLSLKLSQIKDGKEELRNLEDIEFTKDTESITFKDPINIEDLKADKYFLQLPGKNLLVNIKSLDIKEENLLADLEILSTEKILML